MLAVIIILAILVAVLMAVLIWQIFSPKQDTGSSMMLKADITDLNKSMLLLKDDLQKQLNTQLGTSNKQMAAQFQASAKIIKDVTEKLTELDRTNKSVGDVASELKTLQNVLQNPKQRGVLGEYYLDQILKNLLPPGAYKLQYKLGDGLIVDAIIKYGDRLIPIDSKFSLENYNRLVEAGPEQRQSLARVFKDDVKKRIDETAKYVKPGKGTIDQAFMFVPSEGIYYDLLANKVGEAGISGKDLIQYAASKKVSIVGPSTLAANLQIIIQGLQSMKINEDTEKIRKNIEQLQKHLMAHNGYMHKLGSSLGTTVGHFNTTYKELGKIDKDIVKIADTESVVEPELIDRPALDD